MGVYARFISFGLLLGGVSAGPEADTCTRQTCASRGMYLMHRGAKTDAIDSVDTSAEDQDTAVDFQSDTQAALGAQFLIQATFGPTRASLAEVQRASYLQWIQQQMRLPATYHREYYRERSNPSWRFEADAHIGWLREPCRKGARWNEYTMDWSDRGKRLEVRGGAIYIDNNFRTGIKQGSLESTWSRITSFQGFVCDVWEGVNAEVVLSVNQNCNSNSRIFLPNPRPFLDTAPDIPLHLLKIIHGAWALGEDVSDCPISDQDPASRIIVQSYGTFYMYDPRAGLGNNTPENPTKSPSRCVPKHMLNEETCTVPQSASYSGCFFNCGSPGEVANVPTRGHQFSMREVTNRPVIIDLNVDSKYQKNWRREIGKKIVWENVVLSANDQLRQRVAWALSQVFVVSEVGQGDAALTERYLVYYDIFVRHAFGNFFDILKWVTFNPLMGHYLTHVRSSSLDHDGTFPNENYAREIMQLFTIGVNKLNPDGTAVVENGEAVPAYESKDILSLSRVFTGMMLQPARKNEEEESSSLVDPMQIDVRRHDVHPKTTLDGGYVGDVFPLCTDALPSHHYRTRGSRYEFIGAQGQDARALNLQEGSSLRGALCSGSSSGTCKFSAVVHLPGDLECTGNECRQENVDQVKIGELYYQYKPPVCVHTWFAEPTPDETQLMNFDPTPTTGRCLNANGQGTASGMVRLDNTAGSSTARHQQCLDQCRAAGGTGCELKTNGGNPGCFVHTQPVREGDGNDANRYCWPFTDSGNRGFSYIQVLRGPAYCPDGAEIETVQECRQAFEMLGLQYDFTSMHSVDNKPYGCSYTNIRLHFNFGTGRQHNSYRKICRASITVDENGHVSMYGATTTFAPVWQGDGVPSPGTSTGRVTKQARYKGNFPGAQNIESRLFVGTYPPTTPCSTKCSAQVPVYYGPSGVLDEDTVFAFKGKFYKNIEMRVYYGDTGSWFRMPPVFLRSTEDADAERSVMTEIMTSLELLHRHPNTPTFIGKKLIQRFVTSNPTPQYVADVAQAFSTGSFQGTTFSGQYGDIGATIAAILLHPEARTPSSDTPASVNGALREPIVKMIHFMRAMEYSDNHGSVVAMDDMSDVIGQYPFSSPSVFNFYFDDFPLPGHPEPAPAAPEFQILIPGFLAGYLNSMTTLIESGVSMGCKYGGSLGVRARLPQNGEFYNKCPAGTLSWKASFICTDVLPPVEWNYNTCEDQVQFRPDLCEKRRTGEINDGYCHKSCQVCSQDSEKNAMVNELDILLTGGRLTTASKRILHTVYDHSDPGDELRALQKVITMTAEFNTMGPMVPTETPRPGGQRQLRQASSDYKALIMLYLDGGADTWNMLVPRDCSLLDEYVAVRTDLALQNSEMLRVSTTGQACNNFGIHSSLSYIKSLYDSGEAAFVTNIGSLVEPMTLQEYRTGAKRKCFGLFSHSDQTNGAQTLRCQQAGTGARGSGGRLADVVAASNAAGLVTTSFSMSGSATWPVGVDTIAEIVSNDESGGVFNDYERWRQTVGNITAQTHGNLYADAYTQALRDGLESTEYLAGVMRDVQLRTNFQTSGNLAMQFHNVARLMSAHQARQAERDIFYVTIRGWDHHNNMKSSLRNKFNEVNSAVSNFVQEIKAQGLWNNAVLFTESEFARTLDSNGGGSDHAWAGQHWIAGGRIRGGRVLNKYPESIAVDGPQDTGRGRLIPQYPWESMLLPVAEWFGMRDADKEHVFPNIGNFNATHIIPNLFRR